MDAINGLFKLLEYDFYEPLAEIINSFDFIQYILIKIDNLIGSIFGTYDLINGNTLASIITLIILWWAISFSFKIFIHSFNFVRGAFSSILKNDDKTAWRKQWKRKKKK